MSPAVTTVLDDLDMVETPSPWGMAGLTEGERLLKSPKPLLLDDVMPVGLGLAARSGRAR